jgi:hypothetical protein
LFQISVETAAGLTFSDARDFGIPVTELDALGICSDQKRVGDFPSATIVPAGVKTRNLRNRKGYAEFDRFKLRRVAAGFGSVVLASPFSRGSVAL